MESSSDPQAFYHQQNVFVHLIPSLVPITFSTALETARRQQVTRQCSRQVRLYQHAHINALAFWRKKTSPPSALPAD
jgi:hypothetical protein